MPIVPTTSTQRLPTIYLPHGGGPCFFMEWTLGPRDTWDRMAAFLRTLPERYPGARAVLVISAHWEESVVTVQTGARPPLLFDYHGFPAHTYQLTWEAPGEPALAARVRELLGRADIPSREDAQRGFDHGVFVPLKVAFPEALLPTVQLSLDASLDARKHLELGRALAPLRDEGVLIVGSGMSFHNMRVLMRPSARLDSQVFDAWLRQTCEAAPPLREDRLAAWSAAPAARAAHPREEHLLPLMVTSGAAQAEAGRLIFSDEVLGASVSAFEFGATA
ncbi:MAG: dioxygenase [Myxococcales bacterium]|nr:dioxygenase [Myxococcales bacterium]